MQNNEKRHQKTVVIRKALFSLQEHLLPVRNPSKLGHKIMWESDRQCRLQPTKLAISKVYFGVGVLLEI